MKDGPQCEGWGGVAGIGVHGIYAFIHKELAARRAYHRIHRVKKDAVLIREGDPIHDMYIIKQGRE